MNGWRYGTTDGAALKPGQVLRGAESGRKIMLVQRVSGHADEGLCGTDEWVVRLEDGSRSRVTDWQMRFFEPVDEVIWRSTKKPIGSEKL